MLHPIDAGDLACDELGVHAQVDVGRAQAPSLLEREAHGGPLGDVVRGAAERLGDLGQDRAVGRVAQDRPGAGGARVAARGAIGVDQEPHRSAGPADLAA